MRTLGGFGVEFVMQGQRGGKAAERLLRESVEQDIDVNSARYGVGDLPDTRHWLFTVPSEKTTQLRKDDDYDPTDDYTIYYTNVPLSEAEELQLDDDYRRRWGIETSYRVIKNDFLAQSWSRDHRVRLFYFNFACHLYNIWTLANAIRAEDVGHDLGSDGKVFTASRLLQSIEDDPYDMTIPSEPDLSELDNPLGHGFW